MTKPGRFSRSGSRTTLHPSVQDFNGQIISNAFNDEESTVWFVGKNTSRMFPATDFGYPVGTSLRGYRNPGVFSPTYWVSARVSSTAARQPAWAEEVHRNHVTNNARARARLSPTKVIHTPDRVSASSSPSTLYDSDGRFSLTLSINEDMLEEPREGCTSRKEMAATARSRPATTGRYFNASNGLRNSQTQAAWRTRPATAGQWPSTSSTPGLRVQKLTLHQKEAVRDVRDLFSNRVFNKKY